MCSSLKFASQNFALKSYLYQKLSRKTFVEQIPSPPPLDQEGLTLFRIAFCFNILNVSLR